MTDKKGYVPGVCSHPMETVKDKAIFASICPGVGFLHLVLNDKKSVGELRTALERATATWEQCPSWMLSILDSLNRLDPR